MTRSRLRLFVPMVIVVATCGFLECAVLEFPNPSPSAWGLLVMMLLVGGLVE